MEEYDEWPDAVVIRDHILRSRPFICRDIALDVHAIDVASLGKVDQIVDVSCVDHVDDNTADRFDGDVTVREKVKVKLSTLVEAMQCLLEEKHHYLHDTGLNLSLSQGTIYSKTQKATVDIALDVDSRNVIEHSEMVVCARGCGLPVETINLWMNLYTAECNLHYDANSNFLCLLDGEKLVCLVSPENTDSVHANDMTSSAANHSKLSFTDVVTSTSLPHSVERLRKGDILFIPEGWWHCVRSDECTIAVNYWLESPVQSVLETAPHAIPYMLRAVTSAVVEHELKRRFEGDLRRREKLHRKRKFDAPRNTKASWNTHKSFASFMSDLKYEQWFRSVMMKASIENEFVHMAFADMQRLWPVYAKSFPNRWVRILLNLQPESVFILTSYWDALTAGHDPRAHMQQVPRRQK
jgi:hypothetical protein